MARVNLCGSKTATKNRDEDSDSNRTMWHLANNEYGLMEDLSMADLLGTKDQEIDDTIKSISDCSSKKYCNQQALRTIEALGFIS